MLRDDLHIILWDLRNVYIRSFRWLKSHSEFTSIILLFILTLFCFDEYTRELFLKLHCGLLDTLFSFGHWYGSGLPTLYLFVFFFFTGLLLTQKKLHYAGLLIAESFIFTGFITLLLKSTFGRWRPYTNHGFLAFYGFTFGPNEHLSLSSGHVGVAFSLSGILAGMTDKIYLKVFFYVLASITALSRLYHDQHWLSDVMVAAAIGILISNMLFKLRNNSMF
jgi:membrane-associated phospholipid phosphatase